MNLDLVDQKDPVVVLEILDRKAQVVNEASPVCLDQLAQ